MSANTSIEWTATVQPDGSVTPGKTWNPVRGCSVISPGCHSCYAMKQAHRFSGAGQPYKGLTKQTKTGPQWTGVIRTVEDALLEPLWARDIVQQCRAAGVPVFVKQLGAEPFDGSAKHLPADVMFIRDRKGGNPAEWPVDIRIRQFPEVRI